MIRRPRRTLPASLLAMVILAVCVLVATSCIELLVRRRPLIPFATIATWAHQLHWNDTMVLVAGSVVAALGLLSLLCGVLPGKPTVLPLTEADSAFPTDAGVSRNGLRSALRVTLGDTDGVRRGRLRVRRRRISWMAHTERRDTDAVRVAAGNAVAARLSGVGLAITPRLRLRVKHRRNKP
ncbi:MAG: DUF6286 domain-containing protein [Sciscionella sp.]